MTTKQRIRQFIDFKGFSERKFSKKISSSETYFTSTKSIGSEKLEKIHEAFPELNMDWVITGRGIMLFEQPNPEPMKILSDAEQNWLDTLAEQEEKIKDIIQVQDELKKNKPKGGNVAVARD